MKKWVIALRLLLGGAAVVIGLLIVVFYLAGIIPALVAEFHQPLLAGLFAVGVNVAFVAFYGAEWAAWRLLTRLRRHPRWSATLRRPFWYVAEALFVLVGGAMLSLPQAIQIVVVAQAVPLVALYAGIIGLPLLLACFFALLSDLAKNANVE